MNSIGKLWVALIAVAILAIGGYIYPQIAGQKAGGVTNYDELDATAVKVGGANGSRIGPIIAGQAALIGSNASQAASSTVAYDIAVTGVVAGDTVYVQLASSTPQTANQTYWTIIGSKASTTAGFITTLLWNNGPAASPSVSGVGSTTNYIVMHPVTSVPGL